MASDVLDHDSPDDHTDPTSRAQPQMADSTHDRSQSDDKSPTADIKEQTDSATKRTNAKDPSRPRRKKARRACYACQRAHLTCGDERPCLRCIKRGLQDHCHDGVRKKAKYLHDAPNEALVSRNYNQIPQPTPAADATPLAQSSSYYPTPVAPQPFANFGHTPSSAPINSPSTTDSPLINPYAPQQNMVTQPYPSASAQQMPPPQEPVSALTQTSPDAKPAQSFNAPFFDPADPSLFNFDISSLNFGNHYGALEFGMLGHMSSGAVETPDTDNNLMTSIPYDPANPNYTSSYPYNNNPYSAEWPRNTDGARQNSSGQIFSVTGDSSFDGQLNFPNAFAIGENGSISGASPSANIMDFGTGYNSSPVSSAQHLLHNQTQDYNRLQHRPPIRNSFSANDVHQARPTVHRRRRDPSDIYKSVTAPYSYTTGFHALTACLQRRYSPQKTARIARALAAIRPSFISCTKQLNVDDLIFMEKCFQRTLYEYEDYLSAYGTPGLVLRRTGEVAAVGKEFSLLTGWSRDVLLGKEANLNINTGNASGNNTGTSTRGTVTPRASSNGDTAGRLQPVLLPELMEDDNVIEFYEDFAKLAFGDSRGVMTKRCKLLKYKTKDDPGWSADVLGDRENRQGGSNGKPIGPLISGESGMNSLGDRDGKVSCMFCWSIKRDVFDIPMMIVMNFLPMI